MPTTTCCQNCEMFSSTRPLLIETMISTPPSVPIRLPTPPNSETPPIITPATAGSSDSAP